MPKPRKISVNQTTLDMSMAFSNMAADIFENIITQVKNSNLNFQMELSPFSAVIHLKKSILKDKSGNFLMQKTPKPSEKFSNVDEILRKNEALEQEVAKLQRTCEEVNRSLTLVESKLKILDQEITNDSEEIENSLPAHASTPLAKKSISFRKPLSDSGLDLEDSKISSPTSCKTAEFHHNLKDKEKEKAVSQTSKKKNENKKIKTNAKADSDQHKVCDISTLEETLVSKSTVEQNCSSLQSKHVNVSARSTPDKAIKNETNESTDSGLDRSVSVELTPRKVIPAHSLESLIFCDLCQSVFEHKRELVKHKKCEHNPSLEFCCNDCSRTYATYEEKEEHINYRFYCRECSVCFTGCFNYALHVLQLHQEKYAEEIVKNNTQSHSNLMKQFFDDGRRCPCAICTRTELLKKKGVN